MRPDTAKPAAPKDGRWRLLMFGSAAVILLLAGVRVYATFTAPWWAGHFANDLIHYEWAMQRWLDTGSPYNPVEVAGPFVWNDATFLHPPISAVLFLPFLYVPWVLWWVIPLSLFGYFTLIWRPAPWTWPLMALPLLLYPIGAIILNGNTDMWAWAFFAGGLRWGWPAALLVVKPSLLPFAIVGLTNRTWWVILGATAITSVLTMPLTMLWILVVIHSPGGLLYSAGNVWIFAIPLIARLGRTDAPDRVWVPYGVRLGNALGRWEGRLLRLSRAARRSRDRRAGRRTV